MSHQTPMMMTGALATMEASPQAVAGTYASSIWFQILLNRIESRFPGSKVVIEQLAAVLPWGKLWECLTLAFLEYQQGTDFLTILNDVLNLFVTRGPDGITMMAKP